MGGGWSSSALPVRLVVGAALVYLLTLLAMLGVGMRPSLPLSFVPVLLLTNVPLAYAMLRLPMLGAQVGQGGASRAAAAAFGAIAVVAPPLLPGLWRWLWLVIPLALFEIARGRLGRFGDWGRVLLVLFFGYGAVWNLNYLAAAFAPEIHDATFLRIDRALYVAALGAAQDGPLFPALRSAFAVDALQGAYTLLFSELFVVVGLLIVRGENLPRFFATTFCIYLFGIGVFVVYPVVGPHLAYYPELVHPEWLDTEPFGRFMAGWAAEFRSARAFETHNGFGYFVGLPSLHVAMAIWLQLSLRSSPLHFWMGLPVNLAMTASTFLLGYHWMADAVAAAFAVAAVLAARSWLEGRARRCDGEIDYST